MSEWLSHKDDASVKPGDILKGDSGQEWVIGGLIGMGAGPGSECDAPPETPPSYVDGHCRCVVCPRCHHHTGNSHQGHYWAYCLVKRGSRDFHFCCPDPAFGCELEHAS